MGFRPRRAAQGVTVAGRRAFLASLALAAFRPSPVRPAARPAAGRVFTVRGPVGAAEVGTTLVHEHVLVDFIGADKVSPGRYDAEEAFGSVFPHLSELRQRGVQTLVECTPAYLGRDPLLLRRLSEASGLQIVTNTGYYGAAHDRYVPAHAFREGARRLGERWTEELRRGIEDTGVRPGFLKIGVDPGPLSDIDRKLVEAGALCHLETGLTIAVHTGDGRAALDILAVLRERGVSPEAYIWVHAQNERDRATHDWAARQGAWVEFDGVSPEALEGHVASVVDMIRRGHIGRILVSQDAGWYRVGEPGGGRYRPHTFLFDSFLPALRAQGVAEEQVHRLLVLNPARAFAVEVRPLPARG